jgi:hypothetical protein
MTWGVWPTGQEAADELDAVLDEAREAMQSRMRTDLTIERPGDPVTDPETGKVTTPLVPVWAGKGYVRYPGVVFEETTTTGGFRFVASRLMVRIPVDPEILPGDVITIVRDRHNSNLNGRQVAVESTDDQSQATAQRVLVTSYQAGPTR